MNHSHANWHRSATRPLTKEQWLASVEPKLNEFEREYLHRVLARVSAERLAMVLQLDADDAVVELRREMRGQPALAPLTTRSAK